MRNNTPDPPPADGRTRIRLHDVEDLLALIPYLLGYQPRERIVVVGVHHGRVALTAALDLGALLDQDCPRDLLLGPFDELEDGMLLVAVWSRETARADQALSVAGGWIGAERLLDCVHVGPRRWRSTGPHAAGGGVAALGHRPVVAEAVVAGLQVAGTRDEAVAVVAGPAPDADLEQRLRAAEHRVLGLAPRAADQRAVHLQAQLLQREATADELADLAALTGDEEVVRCLWLALDERRAEAAARLWLTVVSRTPARWAAGPVAMAGFTAWLCGNGVVLVASIERLAALGAGGPAASVLDAFNRCAVRPGRWEELRAGEVFAAS